MDDVLAPLPEPDVDVADGDTPFPLRGRRKRGRVRLHRPLLNENGTTRGPAKLNHRHHRLAALAACGKTNEEIAQSLGITHIYVCQLLRDSRIRSLVQDYHDSFFREAAASLQEEIALEGHASLEVVKELRDVAENENVRLRAAQDLLDRNPASAPITKREEDRTIKLILSREDQQSIAGALQEMKVIEAQGRVE